MVNAHQRIVRLNRIRGSFESSWNGVFTYTLQTTRTICIDDVLQRPVWELYHIIHKKIIYLNDKWRIWIIKWEKRMWMPGAWLEFIPVKASSPFRHRLTDGREGNSIPGSENPSLRFVVSTIAIRGLLLAAKSGGKKKMTRQLTSSSDPAEHNSNSTRSARTQYNLDYTNKRTSNKFPGHKHRCTVWSSPLRNYLQLWAAVRKISLFAERADLKGRTLLGHQLTTVVYWWQCRGH